MQIIISNKQIETKYLKPFTSLFDKVYVSFDEDEFEDNNELKLNEKNIKKLFNVLNYSWDGEIYWFKKEDNILIHLDNWFKKQENHLDVDDLGLSNCFLIKETANYTYIIDTQLDMSSNIVSFLNEIEKENPEIKYECYSDSHLIDHIRLGRDSCNNEFETLYFLYKENVIDSSFFLDGIYSLNLEDKEEQYYQLLPYDKEIVITGKLPCERSFILEGLKDVGYKTSEKVTANSWLWCGDKVGVNKIAVAKAKNIVCNSIDEVIEQAYQKYLINIKKLS